MSRRIALAITLLGLVGCDPAIGPVNTPDLTASPNGTNTGPQVDPAPITEGAVTQLSINGMTVLVKRIPGAELAAVQLYVKGGARNWGAADAGVENLAVSVSTSGGTAKLSKDAFARRLASLGSDIGASSGNDYTVFAAKALTPQLDETFDILCDTFLSPALPASGIELQRQNMLSRLHHEEESPDARLGLLSHRSLFKGHPYENRAVGTIESVTKLTAEQIKSHLARLRESSRLLLVVVGDVDAAHIADLAKQKLGGLPRGSFKDAPMPGLSFSASKVEVTSDKLPTNYIQGVFTAPGWRDRDFYAAMVAMEHLGFRMFEEVRTKRNLSYAPKAGYRWSGGVPTGVLYVTAVDPATTIKVMFDEVKKLKAEKLSQKQLEAAKSTFLTGSLMGTETTDGQASSLARAQMFAGDWRVQQTLLDHVKAVSADEVQAFAQKHIGKLQFQIVGNGTIDKGLFGSL
jgi:zinc protease